MLGLDLLCHINSQVMPSCFNRFSIEAPGWVEFGAPVFFHGFKEVEGKSNRVFETRKHMKTYENMMGLGFGIIFSFPEFG